MTRRQYIETFRYELAGLVLEAQMNPRSGAELAMSLRPLFARVDGILGRAFDAANTDLAEPEAPQPAAAKPTTPPKK